MRSEKVLITGGGGFIGGHLVGDLLARGRAVRAVDIKPLQDWWQPHPQAENLVLDLRDATTCRDAVDDATEVYNLAADMGGMGFVERHKALCMLSVLINTQLLSAAREARVERYFYASSACVYATSKQAVASGPGLRESDAYPALPEDGYGWEKLFSERMCRHFREDFALETRVARYHNVYGPHGAWTGGREKAPAAICRKVAEAKLSGSSEIEVWGDGRQTRSFTYIDDCVYGTQAIMRSDAPDPLNLGSSETVTIGELVDLVARIAGISVVARHDLSAPQGVRGRSSDNTMIRERIGWEPATKLADGLERTYAWVFDQVARGARAETGNHALGPQRRAG
jgi:GDP-D-mannose 3',5'-epimerase